MLLSTVVYWYLCSMWVHGGQTSPAPGDYIFVTLNFNPGTDKKSEPREIMHMDH